MVKYCFDTSAFLDAWVRYYPPDIMPDFWNILSEMIENNEIICCKDVYIELEKKDDDILDWCKERKEKFLELDEEVITCLQEIMGTYPTLVDTTKGKHTADPIVISFSKAYNLTLVTGEKGGSVNKPKIPYVCLQENIRCIDILTFIREQHISFHSNRFL